MKYFTILLTAITLVACKQTTQRESTITSTDKSTAPTEADLGLLYQYYHASPTTLEQKDENALIEYAAEKGLSPERTQSGVYIVLQKEGSGPLLNWGEPISTDYRGTFLDGEEFDSSYKRNQPLDFRIGQMIPGWNEALLTRRKGDEFILLIPSHMAYGKRGFPGAVPPDANLIFEIKILDDN